MFDVAMERYAKWCKENPIKKLPPEPEPYRILQNGKGEFRIEERFKYEEDYGYRESLRSYMCARQCKSIAECHEKMKWLIEGRKKREFKKVWP